MENRSGLIVRADLTRADGHAERKAALDMIHTHSQGSTRQLTLGADKGYDSTDFVRSLRQACVTPHVARKARHSAIDGRTTRHAGYALSQNTASGLRNPSAGPRPSAEWPRPLIVASNVCAPRSS